MGIDIRFYKVDKERWKKEKEELEKKPSYIPHENGGGRTITMEANVIMSKFQKEAEFFDEATSVYHSMIYIIEDFYSRKGKEFKFDEYPLYWEKVLILESKYFLELLFDFKNMIIYLKEKLSNPGSSGEESSDKIPDGYYVFDHENKPKTIDWFKYAFRKRANYQYKLIDFEDEIDDWINVMQASNYNHENFEYLIAVE